MKKRVLFMKTSIAFLILCAMALSLGSCFLVGLFPEKYETVFATVIEIEKYGHAILDITTAELAEKGYELGDIICVRFNYCKMDLPLYDGYYTNPGEAMLRGSSPERNVTLCINYGNFATDIGIAIGDTVELSMAQKAGMLAFQELCALQYSNDRADYPDDETFANFREVTAGRMGAGKLYRSASPINNEYLRASYANRLIANANVATVINLADSEEDIAEYFNADDFDSEYYLSLYESGKVITLDMTANFYTESFAAAVAEGLKFMAQNEPPYCIHCTEGKDRAGFTAMVLSALMGAELEEIIDDYMLSFYNYYGITKEDEPERYEAVLNNNLIAMICHVMGVESEEELAAVDFEAAVTQYLLNAGMTEDEILTLKNKLS